MKENYEVQFKENQKELEYRFEELRSYILKVQPFRQSTAPDIDICLQFCKFLLVDAQSPRVKKALNDCFKDIFKGRDICPDIFYNSLR
jgi:hypothetical protein